MKALLLFGFAVMMKLSASAQQDSCKFSAPNIITGNCGDSYGYYEFEVSSTCSISSAKLTIYNRWGEVLFEQEGKKPIWDASKAAVGTYYYVFKGYYAGGVGFEANGYATVVR